ncbi:MAG: hypothetical protein C0622_02255 [Desulfuromonas sp.]|nr:MAG: hypothetical protein C0622_02255 [Desulfuromonas sp.]
MSRTNPLLVAVWSQNRVKIVLIVVLLVAVIAAWFVQRAVVEPRLQELSAAQSRLQMQVRQRQVEYANSGVPVSTAERMEKNLQKFMVMIPGQDDFPRFLGELHDWAERAGLEIHQVNFQPKKDEESGFLQYGLGFSIKGDYAQIKKFIHLLENAERILIIDRIALRGEGQSGKETSVTLQINLTTYFQGESV